MKTPKDDDLTLEELQACMFTAKELAQLDLKELFKKYGCKDLSFACPQSDCQ
jgi:hypothetical protein